MPTVSSLAERFAMTVAPASAWKVEGGRALHKSSHSSTPSTKLGIWRQRNSSDVPKGTCCPQTVTVCTSVLPGVNCRFS